MGRVDEFSSAQSVAYPSQRLEPTVDRHLLPLSIIMLRFPFRFNCSYVHPLIVRPSIRGIGVTLFWIICKTEATSVRV